MPDKTLESFFEQWVYSTGIPSLKLSHTVAGKPPAVRVKLTLTQTGAREDFTTLVPVEVLLPGKRTVTQWLVSSSEPATWELTLKQTPLKISLDPHNFVLKTR
jgi:aminopeptidase N